VSKSIHPAVPASGGAAFSPMVTADFPIIAMGHGKIEVGDGVWEGLPMLWFGNDGQGIGFERERGHGLPIQDRETLVMFTFANIQGLEAIEAAIRRLRTRMTDTQPSSQAAQPDETETRQTQPPAPADRVALAADIKAAINDLSGGSRFPDLMEAVDRLAASDTPPAAQPSEALEHDLVVECERAMKQRDEFLRTGQSTAAHGG
jgi:hypothetical protein